MYQVLRYCLDPNGTSVGFHRGNRITSRTLLCSSPSRSQTTTPPAPVALTHYRLGICVVVWSDSPDKASISNSISRVGEFVTFYKTPGQPNKHRHNSLLTLCNRCTMKYVIITLHVIVSIHNLRIVAPRYGELLSLPVYLTCCVTRFGLPLFPPLCMISSLHTHVCRGSF